MVRKKQFRGFKLPSGDVYFGLKKGTNYAEDYGFEHPDLTPNETSLVSVANNEPGAKGIGGPSIMLKAIQEGATALDAFAVPSEKHPNGFLPSYYSNFGFHELGRIPFEPSYYSPTQVEDMKHYWRSTGWDESMGLPHVAIMKWKGNESDRQNALQNYLTQSSANSGPSDDRPDVRSTSGLAQYGSEENSGQAPVSPLSNGRGDRGGLRNDSSPRPADRFARTFASTLNLNPNQAFAFGLNHEDIGAAKEKMPFLANPQSLPKTPKKAQGGPLTHFNGVNADRKFKGPLPHSQLRRTGLMVSPSPPSLAPAP